MAIDEHAIPATTADPTPKVVSVVIHQTTVIHPDSNQPWKTTVRMQAGWGGPTLSKWERGGYDMQTGLGKTLGDCEAAWLSAQEMIDPF